MDIKVSPDIEAWLKAEVAEGRFAPYDPRLSAEETVNCR